MSGYGVPGIPGRSAGQDPESARLNERNLEEAAHQREQGDKAERPKREGGSFKRLFRRGRSG